MKTYDLLLINIGELLIMRGKRGPRKGSEMSRFEIIKNAAIGIIDGKVDYVGPEADLSDKTAEQVMDCKGKLVTPGLVDPHTHLVWRIERK